MTKARLEEYDSWRILRGSDLMKPKYDIGQKVIVRAAKNQPQSARNSNIGRYAAQIGAVTDYHWISPSGSEVFYIYTVRFGDGQKEIVLHEDEIQADTAKARKRLGLGR